MGGREGGREGEEGGGKVSTSLGSTFLGLELADGVGEVVLREGGREGGREGENMTG